MSSSGLVLILFTDLVDSTRQRSEVGDVAADELRRTHFTGLREALAATGGTEVKTIGDALMATYAGAADALAGAVAMQWSVERHNRRGQGPTQAMRIGISAGDAAFEDGDWFGTPVIEASRLCAVAEGGQILISDLVWALAGSRTDQEIRPARCARAQGLSRGRGGQRGGLVRSGRRVGARSAAAAESVGVDDGGELRGPRPRSTSCSRRPGRPWRGVTGG